VPRLEACLVDAYDTIVTCDFSILRNELSALADISPDTWQIEYARIGALVSDGRISKAEAFAQVLRASGQEARPGLVAELVRQDQELLLANAPLFDDAIPFLRGLRDRGIKIAIVSNCTENTRPLLVKHGVDALADALVLSCEVRSAKPEPEIFRCALDRLGVAAEAALFVDDQAGYCAGSMAAGIRAVQIVRANLDGQGLDGQGLDGQGLDGQGLDGQGLDGQVPAPGTTVVRSLPEVEALFGE
jgi:HAD superfamily hydrolase (TIGR01509 family)